MTAPADTARAAWKIRRTQLFGLGTAIEINGLVILFGLPLLHIGTVIVALPAGLLLLAIGARMSRAIVCERCRAKVDKRAWACPHCSVELTSETVSSRYANRHQ